MKQSALKTLKSMKLFRISLYIAFIACSKIMCTSFVYNLRIAETTRHEALQQTNKNFITGFALIEQWRKTYNNINQSIQGGLGTIVHRSKISYTHIDFAAAHIKTKAGQVKFCNTQTDDILFTGGYCHTFSPKTKCTLSLLAGFPTHKDTTFQGLEFGTGHFSVGTQLDGIFMYSSDHNHAIFGAARYVRFFPRNVSIQVGEFQQCYNFNIGNLVDLFISNRSTFGMHILEIGYNPTFNFGASISPQPPSIDISNFSFIRSNFFASYTFGFFIKSHLNAIILGISYDFDHAPKTIGIKNGVIIWGAWGINF